MVAFVFPGQGSQQKGMGKGLFEEFADMTLLADNILGYSIKQLCLEDPDNRLEFTQYTQPALFVVNAFMYLKKIQQMDGKKPDYVAGHSLGEYNALFAAEVFDFETGLRLVKKRAELMSQSVGGAMAAVIGLEENKINKILSDHGLQAIDIANYNAPTQIVISGLKDDIERAKPIFESEGARMYAMLKVSGAFHSRYMEKARNEFETFLESFIFSTPQIKVVSNIHARPYNSADIKVNMLDQINGSVKWTESVRYLLGKGCWDILQVGPGNIIAGLVKTIKTDASPLMVDDEQPMYEQRHQDISCDRSKTTGLCTEEKELPPDIIIKDEPVMFVNDGVLHNEIEGFSLGDQEFIKDYDLKYPYVIGPMYKNISSKEMVVKAGSSGMLAILGTGGLPHQEIEDAIKYIRENLKNRNCFGVNLIYDVADPQSENGLVDLYLKNGVSNLQVSFYMGITEALVRFRLSGIHKNESGEIIAPHKIICKVSRPETAEAFMSPPPARFVDSLVKKKFITAEEARLASEIPMANDLCVEGDPAGYTNHGSLFASLPVIIALRDKLARAFNFRKKIRVGAAGAIATPKAAAAAFMMGADFILTGSVNQCTVEANISNDAKDMLAQLDIQDTCYVPALSMFEMGAKVQVMKKGVFFHVRANRLYEIYKNHNSFDEINPDVKRTIEEKYFKENSKQVFEKCKKIFSYDEIEKANNDPKKKMALLFKWYLYDAFDMAKKGDKENSIDFQIYCSPGMGAFNNWVKGTHLENWRNRYVNEIGIEILRGAEAILHRNGL
jgi:trans-AT polyketide synthase/acyltransferase/oxidoreductase domain-containing protein